jgi:hypothetical protein
MAETMVFFNVGSRCRNIQKASRFVEISWNWNESSANGKWPILVLRLHYFERLTSELIRRGAEFDGGDDGLLQCRFEMFLEHSKS